MSWAAKLLNGNTCQKYTQLYRWMWKYSPYYVLTFFANVIKYYRNREAHRVGSFNISTLVL